jgi:type IV pilus assembly protein PilE
MMIKTFKQKGFTLLEIMIVVVIIAILAAIAYPSYRQYVLKTRRADCENALLDAAALMERKHAVQNRYDTAGLPLPTQCPAEGTAFYTVTPNVTDTTFTFTATPGSAQTADPCGTLTLNHLGEKTASGGAVEACW